MRKLTFLLFFLTTLSGAAQSFELFEAANEAYAEGNYEEAIEGYEEILDNGETSTALHYNLGNAYYKLNQIAPSIYHYEKALQLDPGDKDVQNNLTFARNMAIDAIEEARPKGFLRIFESTTSAFSAEGWGWVGIFCMLLFVVFILVYYFSRRTLIKRILFISGMFFLILAISSVLIGVMKLNVQKDNEFAIVFAEEAEVKSEPNLRSSEVLILHEGAKVKITEDFQGWYEIELPNGTQGWINAEDLKLL